MIGVNNRGPEVFKSKYGQRNKLLRSALIFIHCSTIGKATGTVREQRALYKWDEQSLSDKLFW